MDIDMSSGDCKNKQDGEADEEEKRPPSSTAPLLDSLSDELVRHVLSWLTPLELLQSVCLVSKRFARQLLHDNDDDESNGDSSSSIWRTSMSVPKNEIAQRFTLHQLHRYCMFEMARKATTNTIDDKNNNTGIEEKKDRDFAAKVPSFLKYGSMLVFKSQTRYVEANRVCLASTTDHRQSESLVNVLPEHGEDDETERFYTNSTIHPRHQVHFDGLFLMRVPHPNPETAPRWWSSRPNLSQDGPQERLLFTLRYPECLISEVWIKPLRYPYVRCNLLWMIILYPTHSLSSRTPCAFT